MKTWRKALVSKDLSVRDVIKVINTVALQIALVADSDDLLLGTVTDGDIRRGILKGVLLESPIELIMNKNPVTASRKDGKKKILDLMMKNVFRHMPIVDDKRRIVGLEVLGELLEPTVRDNWVILMAGGMGQRMRPLTDSRPKPMLLVGDKPILEDILNTFIEYGFRKFYISVNYMAEMIEDYFGDGSKWNVEIRYLREGQKMGTVGAVSLLPEAPTQPFFVMNGDLVTKINPQRLLEFHEDQKAKFTMAVREYDFQVPFGVVKLEKHHITGIDEKPVHKFFVNAGIYILDPEVFTMIPKGEHLDMPTLVQQLIDRQWETAAFPIMEYWLDIGRRSDFERAKTDHAGETE